MGNVPGGSAYFIGACKWTTMIFKSKATTTPYCFLPYDTCTSLFCSIIVIFQHLIFFQYRPLGRVPLMIFEARVWFHVNDILVVPPWLSLPSTCQIFPLGGYPLPGIFLGVPLVSLTTYLVLYCCSGNFSICSIRCTVWNIGLMVPFNDALLML